jgi:hypothetical protein
MPVAVAKKLSANNYAPSQYQMLWNYYLKKFDAKGVTGTESRSRI